MNGNGRHSRATTELLADSMGLPEDTLTWSGDTILDPEEHRKAYLSALRTADRGDYGALTDFMFG